MDVLDATQQNLEKYDDAMSCHIRRAAAEIPIGSPGECAECGDFKTRLVQGVCGRCRDELKAIGVRM